MSCGRTNSLGKDNKCSCSFTDCSNWGKCCSCILYHRTRSEVPGCFFTKEAERVGNRSVSYFIKNIGI
jgi:hypothetical protein